MSKRIEQLDQQPSAAPETGFEALQSSAEFRGPVESLNGHEDIDHFALIYEDRAEQFGTAVPFVRQGLERGERCMYIVDETTRDELVAVLRDGGIDVDRVLQTGQLSIHSAEEAYLEDGEFDVDGARTLLRDATEEAVAEYEGFRVTAEETWLVDDEAAQTEFMTCEAHVNDLIEGTAGMALCQYNRTELPPEVIEDVINTHPYLVYDDTACPNEYYTPPEEYFGPDDPARENERKLETLVDRTDARVSLQDRQRYERAMYEITSDPDRSFEEKLDALLDLGCERFDLDLGGLAKVDPDTDLFEVEVVSGDHDHLVPGAQADLSETYCRVATDRCSGDTVADPVAVTDPIDDGFDGKLCYEEFGVRAYLGSHLEFDEAADRTFWFVSETAREDEFSKAEHTFLHLMGQWVKYELDRNRREQELRERTEHLSALVETTPECIKTVAADGTLLQMNPAGLEMVEADAASDVTDECVYDLIAPEHRDQYREFNERICRGERGTLEYDIVGLDGTRRHMESHAAPLERPDGTTAHVALTRDVTEQVERERKLDEKVTELQESEERLQLALEAGEMGTWELDLQTGDSPVRSPQHDRIFGYDEPLDDWSLETFLGHVHPDDRERVVRCFEEAFETGTWEFECRIAGADGERRVISACGDFYDDSEGKPDRAVGVVQDVTERKQAEEELQKSKEQFRALVTASSDVVYRMSPDWNEMHELEGKDFLSDTVEPTSDWVDKYIHPDDRQRVMDAIDEAIRTESVFELEHRVEQDDGGIGWTFSRAVPMLDEDGEIDEWIGMASDITQRKEREAELRQTKTRFETVFEDSGDSIFIIDSETDEFVDANPAACEMTGYARDELLSRSPSDLHPDELEQFRAFLDEVCENGSAWTEDLHCRAKDGRNIPAEITASAITLDDRDLVLALVRDVDERKKHERYQRDLHEITAATDLSFDEKLERLLELGCDRFGLEIAGLSHLPTRSGEFRLEKSVGLEVDLDEELRTDPDEDCYCRRTVTEEGSVGMADVRGTRWTDDAMYREHEIRSYLGTRVSTGAAPYGTLWFGSTDSRERPFSEAERSFVELMGQWVSYEIERREHNDSQRELYEITADPDLGADEKIERLLEAGCERLNLPVGMLTRKRERAFEIEHMNGFHPDIDEGTLTPPLTDNYCRRVVDTGESISVGDAGAAGWDGDALYHEFDLECYAGTQVTVGGENYGTVFFTDTAPREEFTEAEQAFLDLLGQCVGYELERQQHEADLQEKIDQLEQSNDRLKQFAYAASHDLQEPLRMVSSYLQLLENRYRDELDEDAREFIDFAVDGADRMRAMVDDLLAFSRVEQADGEFEPVDCDAVLEGVTDDLQIQIEENDAEIAADSLPTLLGDREQLGQLFSNLVSNAIKYNDSDRPTVEITADRRVDRWKFAVSDNGIGIESDRTGRIFEVFKRLHHDHEYSGTGIGLSICQEIVENHGGNIRVESEPGEGSTFYFTLPAVGGEGR